MYKMSDYYYKGYDIESKSRLEKMQMEYSNPYGYNLESNERRVRNNDFNAKYTNQDMIKSKSFRGK